MKKDNNVIKDNNENKNKKKYTLVKKVGSALFIVSIITFGATTLIVSSDYLNNKIKYENDMVKYSDEIETFDNIIKPELEEKLFSKKQNNWIDLVFDSFELIDEISEGYGTPTLDPFGNARVNFTINGCTYFCRNTSDLLSSLFNDSPIIEKAMNLNVLLNRKKYLSDLKYQNISCPVESNDYRSNIVHDTLYGNHYVTLLKPVDKNYYVVVDSIQRSFGLLINGKIYSLFSENNEGLKYKLFGQLIYEFNYDIEDINKAFKESKNVNITQEEIDEIQSEIEKHYQMIEEKKQEKKLSIK